jgi:hypothetical protein
LFLADIRKLRVKFYAEFRDVPGAEARRRLEEANEPGTHVDVFWIKVQDEQ